MKYSKSLFEGQNFKELVSLFQSILNSFETLLSVLVGVPFYFHLSVSKQLTKCFRTRLMSIEIGPTKRERFAVARLSNTSEV